MIDIIKSIDGQNNSARFFLYDKLEINPVPIFVLFITSLMLLSFSDSVTFHLFCGVIIIIISASIKELNTLVIKPVLGFRIFFLFSFVFSYLTSYDLKISFLFLAKVILLVILSRWFNYFVDHRSLLKNLDDYFSNIKPVFIRKALRKSSFSIILGIEFVSELISGAKIIKSETVEAEKSGITEIIKWEKSPQSLSVTRPRRVTRIQRRNFVRVEAELPLTLIIPQQDEKKLVIKSVTTDISGGGLLVFLSQFLQLFTELDVELEIPTGSAKPVILKIQAQVCRNTKIRDDFYQIGLSFLDIEESDRDKIVKYIFKRMRELKQTRVNS